MADPAGRSLEFFKMSGAGNDFIVADNRTGIWGSYDLPALARGLCRRNLSVGADGLILVENSKRARFRIRIYNPDGGEAAMCGNGGRCAARFAFLRVIAGRQVTLETAAGVLGAEVLTDGRVRLEIPVRLAAPESVRLELDGRAVSGYLVDTGVPHLVVFVKDIERAPVEALGRRLRSHPGLGGDGANVNFVGPPRADGVVPMRTYERGVEGETLACGTGIVASALVSARAGRVKPPVKVTAAGGVLTVGFTLTGDGAADVTLLGPAEYVFQGVLEHR